MINLTRVKKIDIVSFGYKYREVPKANLVVDVRFLKNPYYDEALRPFSGLDQVIQDYVLNQEPCQEFLAMFSQMLSLLLNGYDSFGTSHDAIVIAFGCTGGKHRSVTLAIECSKILAGLTKVEVEVNHLDLGKE